MIFGVSGLVNEMAIPTLIYNNTRLRLKQIHRDVFELHSADYIIQHSKFIKQIKTSDKNIDVSNKPLSKDIVLRKNKGGKTAFIIPIFSFHKNKQCLENYTRLKDSLESNDIFVIELSYFDLPFYIPDSENFIRLRGNEKNLMWQKERLINIAIENIPSKYKNIAWIDGDIVFKTKDLSKQINEKLNQHSVIQLFETANQLDEQGYIFKTWKTCVGNKNGHTGFAWAIRREELKKIDGLFDCHITGNGDCLLEYLFSGNIKSMSTQLLNTSFGIAYFMNKQKQNVNKYILSSMGNLPVEIDHSFHGAYSNRKYELRENILTNHQFDPMLDIKIDKDTGLYEWTMDRDGSKELFHDVFRYINRYK